MVSQTNETNETDTLASLRGEIDWLERRIEHVAEQRDVLLAALKQLRAWMRHIPPTTEFNIEGGLALVAAIKDADAAIEKAERR